jgi:hypothetical protein
MIPDHLAREAKAIRDMANVGGQEHMTGIFRRAQSERVLRAFFPIAGENDPLWVELTEIQNGIEVTTKYLKEKA